MPSESQRTENGAMPAAAFVAADPKLTAALREAGVASGEPEQALVFAAAATAPVSWEEVERILLEAFELSKRAVAARAPIVYVVDGAAIYGHGGPLAATLATGLLGGARSLAAEGRREGIAVNTVTAGANEDPARTAAAVAGLLAGDATGQLLHLDGPHIGRPAV